MATAMMLKSKPNLKLPLYFLRTPISSLTRPVAPILKPELTNEAPQLSLNKASTFPLLGMTQKLFTGESGFDAVRNGGFGVADRAVFVRQMGTSRSPRGSSSRNEDMDDVDEEDVEDLDGDADDLDDEGLDDFDEDEDNVEGYEDDEEEEKPKKKRWLGCCSC